MQDEQSFTVTVRGQQAPYDTIHNIPSIMDITRYAGQTLDVNMLSAGVVFVEPVESDITIALPSDLSFFRFLGGFKYIANGDMQTIKVINRGTNAAIFTHNNIDVEIASGMCGCMTVRWTTVDELGFDLPLEDVYYTLLDDNLCVPVVANPITVSDIIVVSPPYLDQYDAKYDITWTAYPNATSYGFTTDCFVPYTFVQTSTTSAILYVQWIGFGNFSITVTGYNDCSDAGSSGNAFMPCFLAGSLVRMEDGTDKAIEDVKVGDKVVGAFGEINTVLALHRPILGNGKMIRINDEHSTTEHHPHIGSDKHFYTGDIDAVTKSTYGREHEVINAEGKVEKMMLHGLKEDRLWKLGLGIKLKTIDGEREVKKIERLDMPSDTQLYNLAVSGSHTFHVDGYAVTGWPREDDFDYDKWEVRIKRN